MGSALLDNIVVSRNLSGQGAKETVIQRQGYSVGQTLWGTRVLHRFIGHRRGARGQIIPARLELIKRNAGADIFRQSPSIVGSEVL